VHAFGKYYLVEVHAPGVTPDQLVQPELLQHFLVVSNQVVPATCMKHGPNGFNCDFFYSDALKLRVDQVEVFHNERVTFKFAAGNNAQYNDNLALNANGKDECLFVALLVKLLCMVL
jgi:hypothetical protein